MREIQGEDLTADYGIPHIFENASEGVYNYMIMDLLGSSLDNIMVDKGGKLDVKFALEMGEQMIERI